MPFSLNKRNQSNCGNPTLWIIIIIISIVFSLFATLPTTQKYLKLRSNIINLEEMNDDYETNINIKKKKLESISNDFNKIANDFLKEEKLLFPEKINTNNIAKILELYSIQYSLINSNSIFELNSISFSKQTSENYTKTSASISIKSTKKSLQDFIYFIQNNKIPDSLLVAQKSSPILKKDISTNKFLNQNILPIANIESIISNKSEDSESSISGLLNTDIKINFFSQRIDNE